MGYQSYNFLINTVSDGAVNEAIRKYAGGKLLDIGCGEKPFEEIAKLVVTAHIGVDHISTLHDKSRIDIFATAYDLPFESESFDSVLCTGVLTQLEEPSVAIAAAFRVLKPGGYAIYYANLYWHLAEEPRDFYRYTKYGLRYLFLKNGFEIVEIKPISGFCVTFLQELVYFLYDYPQFRRGRILRRWILPPIGFALQSGGLLLNKIDHSETFTVAYLAVARKPG